MPVIKISGNEGITIEKKREMVREVSEAVAKAYDLPVSTITVLVESFSYEDIGSSGKLLSDLKGE